MSITASVVPWPAAGLRWPAAGDHKASSSSPARRSRGCASNLRGAKIIFETSQARGGSQRVEIPDDQRRRGSCRVLIRGTATPHRKSPCHEGEDNLND